MGADGLCCSIFLCTQTFPYEHLQPFQMSHPVAAQPLKRLKHDSVKALPFTLPQLLFVG